MLRFYSVKGGEILIGGLPINALDINWLRNNVTLVQQQTVLFSETLFKNIALGHRDHSQISKEEIKRAIETALLQQTIGNLPHGLETAVGTGGRALSGGQQQRVAIARARLRDTPILILDEATSALDQVSKNLVVDAIREWRKGKTTIVITHDMSQVQDEDYAYVLDNGSVIQEGFKKTLRNSGLGPFRQQEKPTLHFPMVRRHGERLQQYDPTSCPGSETPLTRHSGIQTVPQIVPEKSLVYDIMESHPPDVRLPSQALVSLSSPTSNHRSSVPCADLQYHQRQIPTYRHTSESITPLQPQDVTSVEMIEMQSNVVGVKPNAEQQSHAVGSPVASSRKSKRKRKLVKAENIRRVATMGKILMTVWPALSWRKRTVLVLSFCCAAFHAAATPTFSFVFSKLLATFYLADHGERSRMALQWSLKVFGIAVVDSLAAFFMHFLLDYCGQAWIDTLRVEALKRILNQPRSWFDKDRNNVSRLTECLDRNAEETRNLLGRFAGYVFVAGTMMTMAITWSLLLSWKLTLVGLASAPFMYVVTRTFESVSSHWEKRTNDAATSANAIFAETFSNIRTVRALTLESYQSKKYSKPSRRLSK